MTSSEIPEITIARREHAVNAPVSPQLKEALLSTLPQIETGCLMQLTDGSLILASDWELIKGLPEPIRKIVVMDAAAHTMGTLFLNGNLEEPEKISVGSIVQPEGNDAVDFVTGLRSMKSPLFPELRKQTLVLLQEEWGAKNEKISEATGDRNHTEELIRRLTEVIV